MIPDLFMITFIICYIVDVVEIPTMVINRFIKWFIKSFDGNRKIIKPIECSTCLSFWFGLGYMVLTHQISLLHIFIVVLLSLLAEQISQFQWVLKDTIGNLFNKIAG